MNTENLTFHDCPNAQIIEDIHLVLPSVGVAILTHALIIEAIDTADLSGFMISSQQCDVAWVSDFEAHK